MNFKYSQQDDILMLELSNKPIDYAEQSDNMIVHFSQQRKAALLEVLEASKFLKQASKSLPRQVKEKVLQSV